MYKYLFLGILLIPQILALISINNRNFSIVSFFPPDRDNGPIPNAEFILSPTPTTNITGRLTYILIPPANSLGYMKPFSDLINKYHHQNGAIGILAAPKTIYRVPGSNTYAAVGIDYTLPVGVVYRSTIDYVRALGKNVTISVIFYGYDENPWATLEDGVGLIMFSLVTILLYLFNTVFAGYRLAMWIWVKRGIDPNIGFLCLSLEWLCNLLRVIQLFFWGVHNNFRIPYIDILYTVPWCITSVTAVIIVFFWLDLTSDPLYHGKFMGIMKIPAGIFIFGLIVIEVFFDVWRTFGREFTGIISAVYGSALMFIVIVNFIAAYRILRPFDKTVETKKKIRKVVYRIVGSGLATIFGCTVLYCFQIPNSQDTPVTKGVMWFLLYFFFFLQSLLLIMIFKVPKDKKGASSNSGKDTKDTKSKSKEPTE